MKPDTSVLVRVIQGRRAAVLCQSTCIGLCQGYSSQNCRVCECACECACECVCVCVCQMKGLPPAVRPTLGEPWSELLSSTALSWQQSDASLGRGLLWCRAPQDWGPVWNPGARVTAHPGRAVGKA